MKVNKGKIHITIGENSHITTWFDIGHRILFFHDHTGDVKHAVRKAVRAKMFLRYGINPIVAEALAQSACSLALLSMQLEDLRVRNWR